uniref:two-component response regulator-like APRR2 n=1 Tax=Erigeron canadensis TaxID=72917 RepID=UPI001CB8E897|nr:two-component response regulator-like APRR2 [Erigeron canadensis]XP_043609509.1 two-component response regulator-like APRR2 [Erigeron canadensis]XP_043609516.1 two-component response regulator-like APRR2 [Erigeron canadensis]
MVCTATDLLEWKEFPKGLKVLLLDEDTSSANQIRSKLEEMSYVVSMFHSEDEALSAISDKSKRFHVAIVEVRADNEDGRFKFLKSAKDLPTIMTSDVKCISTMMKCIALGAVEILEKPLSEDKLRNIWQHVAHKAFNAGPKDQSEFEVKTECDQHHEQKIEEVSVESDKYPAPSTPQLKQGMRLVDNGDCHDQDQTHVSNEKESVDHDGESKFVETTCDDLVGDTTTTTITTVTNSAKSLEEGVGKPTSDGSCPDVQDDGKKRNEPSDRPNTRASKTIRKKIKVDWTSELHKKFVQAVEQLGVDQAIPSRILELMNVEGLTRHNVASHLQKYRLQRRHILPKESGRKWPQTRHSSPRTYYPPKPIMAYPPYYPSHTFPPNQVYPAWPPPHNYASPPPHSYASQPQMWSPPYYQAWQSSENWMWNPYSGVQAEAWGCPAAPPHASFPRTASPFQSRDSMQTSQSMPKNSVDNYPGDEVIDKVVKEAINKPWLPLPLGLKPPSTESVISELFKQGISTVPPRINGSH